MSYCHIIFVFTDNSNHVALFIFLSCIFLVLINDSVIYVAIIPVSVYNNGMYSVKEAAQKLGLDTSQVRRLLAKGSIKGKKLARDWIVLELNYTRRRKPKTRRKSVQS